MAVSTANRSAQKTLFTKRATELGTYHTASIGKAALRHYLQGLASTQFKTAETTQCWWENNQELRKFLRNTDDQFFKNASIGGEPEQGFEQALSSLGYAFLKDKAPRLIDFIVGFQLIERNEDNTKACGVFGFKVGDMWLYVPLFFLNGDLKGHELLYVKKQNMFVPLKENWVNHLIARRPHTMGKPSPYTAHQLGGMQPNVRRFSELSSALSKYGSLAVDDWAKPFLPLACAMATKKASVFYPGRSGTLNFAAVVEQPNQAALAPFNFDLREKLADVRLLKAAYALARSYPAIKHGFDRFYGPTFFRDVAEDCRAKENSLFKTSESYIVPPKKKKSPFLIPEPEKRDKNAELEIHALDVSDDVAVTVNKPDLTDAEREKLLHDTVLIKDKRDPHATSMVYNTQVAVELMNPGETGLHTVLEQPGEFSEMIVITAPHSGRGRENFCVVVRKSAPKNWKNLHRTNLWVKANDNDKTAWAKYVDGLSDRQSLSKGGTYLLVHANGSGTCAFEVVEDYGDGLYSVNWKDYLSWRDRPALPHTDYKTDSLSDCNSFRARLRFNKNAGSGLRSVNGELIVPESYKVIKLKDPPKPKKERSHTLSCFEIGFDGDSEAGSDEQPIKPGNLADIQVMLRKEASAVEIFDHGPTVRIVSPLGTQHLNKTAALISLVRDHGLREGPARLMLQKAAERTLHRKTAEFLVKYAYGYGPNVSGLEGGPNAPPYPPPEYGVEPVGHESVQSIYPQEEVYPVPELDSGLTDPSIYDPFYMPDPQTTQVAQQAALSGQKEVFDTSMFSGILKSVGQAELVDKRLGDIMKALDAYGNLLMAFYWHQEDFKNRYGADELPELEDGLRNTFQAIGDSALTLLEKDVRGLTGINAGFGDGNRAEADISEVARN